MIEKTIYDYLTRETETAVFMEYPENPPARFIVVTKTGGGGDLLRAATVAVQSYAATLFDAAQLNEDVKRLMFDAVSVPNISKVELNSDYEFTDTEKKRYRYQAVYDLVYMEV